MSVRRPHLRRVHLRRAGTAVALAAALTAASCSSAEEAGDQAGSAASDATSAVESAADEATGPGDTDAPLEQLVLTPEETAPIEMTPMDEEMMKQASQGMEMPEGAELVVDPPECADATDLQAQIQKDVGEGGIAAVMGTADDQLSVIHLQVARMSVSFDDYKRNWSNCDDATITSEKLGMSGTSRSIPGPEIEGADEVIARVTEVMVTPDTSELEALGIGSADAAGGVMATHVYLTEVRGVKIVAGAMSPAAETGGKLDPATEQQLKDLLTKQVAKINDAG